MRAVVVYESIYGNTRAVAQAIAEGLGDHAEVAVLPVSAAGADALAGADLLVVGGPTHMHGLSTSFSRRSAAQAAAEDGDHTALDPHATEGPGLRAWLSALPRSERSAAAFDTRLDRAAMLTGTAARGIARRLRHHGHAIVAEPESFFVTESEGPLEDDELTRARAWGAALGVRGASAASL
jgi:hypothetical protein